MIETFLATLSPMLMLFLCIAIGFVLNKTKILPENAAKVLAKLETWVLMPALNFSTMARFCTLDTLATHGTNLVVSAICVGIALGLAIPLSCLIIRKESYERCVYKYALTFANCGFMGDPLILAMFGEEVLSYYKLICLPFNLVIYTWGMSVLLPKKEGKKDNLLKKMINPPTVAILLGIVVGLITGSISSYDKIMPEFLVSTIDGLKSCMGPIAMILAGFTIGNYKFKSMLAKKKVYLATILRLIILPAVILAILFGLKELANLIFSINVDNTPLILLFFAIATPLGLNTIVIPEAYGGDSETGAAMTMISHTLCVITIPLTFALCLALFGGNTWLF